MWTRPNRQPRPKEPQDAYNEAKQRFARRRFLFERLRPQDLDRATNPDEPENVGRFPEGTH